MIIKITQYIKTNNMLTQEQFNAFKLEIATFGNIPISSKNCGIGCIYCKVHSDPILKRYPPIPEISMDDLYEGFKYVDNTSKYLRLGAGVLVAPHTDPYLHPLIYDFIKHTTDYFPQKRITTVTTGSYIEESKVEFLRSISNFGIDLSLITMQDNRETIVPRATRNRLNFLLQNAQPILNKITLMFSGNLDYLKRDLDLLHSLGIDENNRHILVRRIEHTAFSQHNLNSISYDSINGYEECVRFLTLNYPKVVFTVPVLKDAFRGGSNEYFEQAEERISILKQRIDKERSSNFEIICSESGFQYFMHRFEDYRNIEVHLVKNQLYGGSVTVSGLLNHSDIKAQLKPKWSDSILVLPYEMYNHEHCDITGQPVKELETFYNREIWTT
jgi:hypothetical protein